MRDCNAVADNMAAYQKLYKTLEGGFDGCKRNYILGENNTEADELANIGSTRGPVPPGVFLKRISQRSIKINPAAREGVADTEDASKIEQVVAASSVDNTRSQAIEGTEPVALEGPAWAKPFLQFLIVGT